MSIHLSLVDYPLLCFLLFLSCTHHQYSIYTHTVTQDKSHGRWGHRACAYIRALVWSTRSETAALSLLKTFIFYISFSKIFLFFSLLHNFTSLPKEKEHIKRALYLCMEMEDHNHHHHHHHHQQQQHQYGITADLRQLMSSIGSSNNRTATHFTAIPQPRDLFSGHHRDLSLQGHGRHYDMLMVGHLHHHDLTPRGELHEFRSDSASTAAAAVTNGAIGPASSVSMSGLEGEKGSFGGDAGTGRWPRQETLTLLEIRSRLDPKFKEANQKGPLWDEVSRIMSKEHGYQRSGKKCREKFENLYKYYKKTKEGKAGRQDGKHYRFFRQLEALYGETSNAASVPETPYLANTLQFHTTSNTSNRPNQEACHSQKLCDSLSLSNSSDFDISSSDGNDLSTKENDSKDRRRKRGGGRSWKAKIKEFIDSQMRKLMEKQEAWLVKLTKTLEQKEQERNLREEEWRKQEAVRIDREHKFWAKERAWIEARDAAFMDALQNITGKQLKALCREEFMGAEIQNYSEHQKENGSETMETVKADSWEESEITRLVDLRNSMESSFQENGCANEVLWE
ncbi:Myb_DNA-bind_4 domain-containing protein [Cephalotus follicularis]|uniref:Myb_DNA-bind_4 domain-containing protein n=1 Tax=Cephalotus follicularis TaxID=3775 RepID=A0A1Q3CQ97_CEPFO|nr:Myb_DNA-bind_4 domain-containing protein [Cephalotus follicularis]